MVNNDIEAIDDTDNTNNDNNNSGNFRNQIVSITLCSLTVSLIIAITVCSFIIQPISSRHLLTKTKPGAKSPPPEPILTANKVLWAKAPTKAKVHGTVKLLSGSGNAYIFKHNMISGTQQVAIDSIGGQCYPGNLVLRFYVAQQQQQAQTAIIEWSGRDQAAQIECCRWRNYFSLPVSKPCQNPKVQSKL